MQGITEQKVRAYFLGDMTSDEAFAFEMESAMSAQLTDFVRGAETTLVDDFVAGRLSPALSEKFKKKYLVTAARLERCRVAVGIRDLVREQTNETPVAPPIGNWFEHNVLSRKKFVTFLVGLCFLICVGLIAANFLIGAVDQNEVAAVETARPPLPAIESVTEIPVTAPSVELPDVDRPRPAAEERAATQPSVIEKPVANKSSASAAPEMSPVDIKNSNVNAKKRSMVVKLLPGQNRGAAAQPVKIDSDVDRVLVLLSPGGDPNRYRKLQAIVRTPEDQTVYSTPELKSLSFTIAASKLENRTYIVTLQGQNGENRLENIARYTFMISR